MYEQLEKLNNRTDHVRESLDAAWGSRNIAKACGILVDDVRRRCIGWLLNGFKSMSKDDAEECFDAAVEGVLRRGPENVKNVYSYVFTSARRNALGIVAEREHFADYDPRWIEGASEDRMLVIAEAVLDEELTVRADQLRKLYTLTLPKLAPRRRRLTEILLAHGASISNGLLAEMMGTTPEALKSLKSRTFSNLRSLLPASADELGLNFDDVLSPPPEVLSPRPFLPSEDDGEAAL